MYFDSLSAALSMDGHGGYVWAAYLLTVCVLGFILLLPRRRQRRVLRQLAGEIKRQRQANPNSTEVS
jgi:heme exporter protein D